MGPTSHLSTLTPEILQLIIQHAHASSHWPLAQTCKHIYLNSQSTLRLHHTAHEKFRIVSDISPLTVPDLLWGVFSDGAASINAWHVREFEVWGSRTGFGRQWGHWTPWELDATGEVREGDEMVPWPFEDEDIDYLRGKITFLPQFIGEDGHYYDSAWNEFTTGEDGFLKGLLLAHLPRIRAVRFAMNEADQHSSLEWLCKFTYWCQATGTWLPGLKTLENIAVGIQIHRLDAESEYWPFDYPDRRAYNLNALLCLPNISKIYYSHLEEDFDLTELDEVFRDGQFPPAPKTSPIKTLIIDNAVVLLSDKLIDFICKSPSSLQNLVIGSSAYNRPADEPLFDRLISELNKHQGSSLQRLFFGSDQGIIGQSSFNWLRPDQLIGFDHIRVGTIDLADVEATLDPTGEIENRSELLGRLLDIFRTGFPVKLESISFFQSHKSTFQAGDIDGDAELDHIDDAVKAMIESGRYKNLKVIYLERVQNRAFKITGIIGSFPKAMEAAKERGIYVHVRGGKPPPGLVTEGEFVTTPNREDMKTGPFGP